VAGQRLAVTSEVVDLAERTGDRAMALRGRGLRRVDLLELSDLAGFDADLAAAEQTAQQLRQLHYHWQLPLARAIRALLAGRFAQAEEQAAQGLAIGRRAGDQAVEIYYAGSSGPCGSCRAASARRSSCSRAWRPASRRWRCSGHALLPRWPRLPAPTRRGLRPSGWPPTTWQRCPGT
jgi:hypothetical protein